MLHRPVWNEVAMSRVIGPIALQIYLYNSGLLGLAFAY